ncbi:exodeoxyribonuclease V subunit gamma [Synechococcus sp. UW179A]|uniref:exodeoxyribonuclease V subunit gamma n=1 Tax=Synechococcus sp. UW179A TaxID=2575510 RepID=UPI000E0FDD0F|nr:exodeoxyribonuclease V subunit gamma [Synechococcus sp. UW179A]
MLRVYRSNRAELLAELLAQELRIEPPGPFEQIEVVVNTWPTSRWLGEQLARVNGISALVRFPFPGSRLRQLAQTILSDAPAIEDPWRAERLVWQVLEVLPKLLDQRCASNLREWWELHGGQQGRLNRDQWQLARSLADAIDDYALYRPEELADWLAGGAGEELPEGLRWQPFLARALAERLPCKPFGLQVQQAVERLRNGQDPALPLPPRLRLFGVSNLAPVQINLLQALSGRISVDLFLLTPCPDLWQRSQRRRSQLGEDWTNSPDGSWLIEAPRLEGILGRMGAEFQLLLEGSGECLLGSWEQGDLFADPTVMKQQEDSQASLLEQLQRQLARGETDQVSLSLTQGDYSLLFMGCAGPWREVQLVRDRILSWMAADPTLQPRDVLVMTPDVERYAPLLASVFSDRDATGVDLPWRLTDRSQQNCPGLQQAFMSLLRLSADRLTASGLEALLGNPALQNLKQLSSQDAMAITDALQRSGFRWGLDAAERNGDESNSLRWCLDRWLLGLALPEEPGLAVDSCAPALTDLSLQQLEVWWPLLDQLAGWIAQLRRSTACTSWVDRLRRLLQEIFNDGGNWDWELQAIHQCLETWQLQASDCSLELDIAVVISVLEEALSTESGRFGHRSGALTISALEPMRAIPHRVIVLMGLDASSFPRHQERAGFHLLELQRRLGDPSSTDQDRYVLLEALLSARQHLLISWSSRDERQGKSLPPCPPVQQWLSLLAEQLDPQDMDQLLMHPPANPLDVANFMATPKADAISCDRRLLDARRNLDAQIGIEQPHRDLGLALPLTWQHPTSDAALPITSESIETLERWLQAPQKEWLKRQGIDAGEWCDPVNDLSPLSLPELDCHQLLNQRLSEQFDLLANDPNSRWDVEETGDWIARSYGQGLMPPGAAAELDDERLERRWQNLQKTVLSLGPVRLLLQQASQHSALVMAGETAVQISTSRLRSRSLLQSWLKHLLAQLDGADCNTAVVCRQDGSTKADQFHIAMRWRALKPLEAEHEIRVLQRLAQHGSNVCWPIPPDSGLARALAWSKGEGAADRAFVNRWQGGFSGWAERDQPEQKVCFGSNCNAELLLGHGGFKAAFQALYEPLLEARC